MCPFAPSKTRRKSFYPIDLIWRPRRDLNPCYRRERASTACNLLKTEDTDGYQSTSEDISEMLIGRQLDALSGQSGARRAVRSSMILKGPRLGTAVWPLEGTVMIDALVHRGSWKPEGQQSRIHSYSVVRVSHAGNPTTYQYATKRNGRSRVRATVATSEYATTIEERGTFQVIGG